MNSILIIEKVSIENANTVFGMTYGFPSISNFLGFTKALSNKIKEKYFAKLNSCAIVSHSYELKVKQFDRFRDPVFTLTRNPLNAMGLTPAFNEEGKMHLTASLLMECEFDYESLSVDEENRKAEIIEFENYVKHEFYKMRIAGGTILNIKNVSLKKIPEKEDDIELFNKKLLYSFIPGFFLISREELLNEYHAKKLEENKEQEIVDSWLDFYTLKYHSVEDKEGENKKIIWEKIKNISEGYIVPLAIGYQPLTDVLKNHEVLNTRDQVSDFCFVEPAYSLAEWKSPHRIKNLDEIFWQYTYKNNFYSFIKG